MADKGGPPSKKPKIEGKEEFVEVVVCKVNDMKDNEMREVDVGEGKVLLVKDHGNFYACSTKCTHYNAPLVRGAYSNSHVRCPWHGACFNVKTGDIEDYPGLDSLHSYEVKIVKDEVWVKASKQKLANPRRNKTPGCKATASSTILIIGGGGAAATCAETLRQEGFEGKIIIATKENCLPYDRPMLSKQMQKTAGDLTLRQKDFYENNSISIVLNKEATSVDTGKKSVSFRDGSVMKYDKLLIATGGSPRVSQEPGNDLENIFQLRTPDEANIINEKMTGKNVVIIGSSFIGMEGAAYACGMGKANSVTVIGNSNLPFEKSLGVEVGKMYKNLHEAKGTKMYGNESVKEFIGDNGKLKSVVLSNGTTIPADLCLVGIGVYPTTSFLKGSGITLTDRDYIVVNKCMETNVKDVFAAGDIVSFPLFLRNDESCNVQHWQMALQHGRIAAFNMLNKRKEIKSVPYFWTMQLGKSLQYTGYAAGYDDVIIHGSTQEMSFVAYYTKGADVVAVAAMNYDQIVQKAAEILLVGGIKKDEIKTDPKSWYSRL